jgi:hypothetical protein
MRGYPSISRRVFTVLAALGCALPLASVVATDASAAKAVRSQVIFNDPRNRDGAKNIENALLYLIKGSPKGSSIKLSVYEFTTAYPIQQALARAYRRGVNVHVISDSVSLNRRSTGGQPTAYERLKEVIGNKAITCPAGRGCIGKQMNHNKFWLFSKTRGVRNMVVQTSQNLLATGGTTTDWNDAVFVGNAPGEYRAYSIYFSDLWSRRPNTNIWKAIGGSLSGPNLTVQFFPKATGDPVAGMLNRVACTYRDARGTTQTTKIRIAMSDINAQREWVLNGLGRLKRKGCQVEVLTTVDPNVPAEVGVLGTLRNAGIRTDAVNPHRTANLMHSKYILVAGKIGSRVGKWTWTGSANLTFGALRSSDETMIQLKQVGAKNSAAIHDQYLCNFWRARAHHLGQQSPC